jgi:hypothetical protein
MNTFRSKTTKLLLAGFLALAFSVVTTGSAGAHTMPKKVAKKVAKHAIDSLVVVLKREGMTVKRYGVESCRRLSKHKFACVTYLKTPDEYGLLTCTQEWQIGVRRHSQYNPTVRYMRDAERCHYPAPPVQKG